MNTPSHACLSAGLTLLALAACQPAHQVEETSPAAVPNEMSVTTKQQFREKVVGKQLTSKNGNATIHDDGTMTGAFGADVLNGSWTWEDR